jgi:hypothetical protein
MFQAGILVVGVSKRVSFDLFCSSDDTMQKASHATTMSSMEQLSKW